MHTIPYRMISPSRFFFPFWIHISFIIQFTAASKKTLPPPQPAMISFRAERPQYSGTILLIWHWTQTALNFFFLLSFYACVVAVVERTQNTTSDRCWPKFQVCHLLALRPCVGQPPPWASVFSPVTWKWLYLLHKDVTRKEVKASCGAQHIADDSYHNCWFPVFLEHYLACNGQFSEYLLNEWINDY